MLLADRHPPTIPVSELAQHLTGWNLQTFLRLRMTLGMGLRRQVYIALCDDVALRDVLAEKLAHDLPRLSGDVLRNGSSQDSGSPNHASGLSNFLELELGLSARLKTPKVEDRFLSLTLQPTDPTLLGQVFHQLQRESVLGVQVLGLEQLTRQPVHIQRAFLNHIRALGRNQLPNLEGNVLLWVTRPWWRSMQQSAPEFVRWHTGLFEFEGDPAPAGPLLSHPAIMDYPSVTLIRRDGSPLAEREAEQEPALAGFGHRRMDDPVLEAADLPDNWADIAKSLPEVEPAVDPASPTTTPHLQPSAEELDLADLVLASVMQAVTQDPETTDLTTEAASDHPSFAPIRILQQVEALQQQAAEPEEFAAVYRQLGDWYREEATQTNQYQAMLLGIRAYGIAGRFLPEHHEMRPDLLNDSGNLYWMLSRNSDRAATSLADLEAAVTHYHQAIEITDGAQTTTIAMLQNNLGAAYGDMAQRQEPRTNLQNSIHAYQAALQYRTPETDPSRYAATQNNLGTAYWNLGQHEELTVNLQRAITAYREALQHYDPETEPLHFAMIQNNLGTAYWNLAQCDLSDQGEGSLEAMPEDFLHLAIGAYRVALLYRTLEVAPSAYAATQNNLGTAYWHLANQHGTHFEEIQPGLDQAIGSYEACLAAVLRHRVSATFDLAATHNNLASAYHQAATNRHCTIAPAQKTQYLDAALTHYLQAFQGWSHQTEFQDAAFGGLMQTVRSFYDCLGLQGQTQALSKIPAPMLPTVMKAL
jgi:tetratricopeptide (TPR) repeat protein